MIHFPEPRLPPAASRAVLPLAAAATILVLLAIVKPLAPSGTLPRPARPDPPLSAQAPSKGPLHPVPAAPVRPLPRLAASDEVVRESLAKVPGGAEAAEALRPEVLRRFVETTLQATRPTLPSRLMPIAGPDSAMPPASGRRYRWLTHEHFERYQPYVRLLERIDLRAAAALYGRLYPLIQQAFEEREGRGGYFNDRLVAAIDHLLESPQPSGPLRVVRAGALLKFADPDLESRSGGQKLLMRMGPENAARVKARLREARALIARPPASR